MKEGRLKGVWEKRESGFSGGGLYRGDGLWQKLNQLEPSVGNRRPLVYVCHPITSGYGLFTF